MIQVRLLKRKKREVKVDPKLGGQWKEKEKEKVPMLRSQWKEKEKVFMLRGQWKEKEKVFMLKGQWKEKEKEKVLFHLFPLSPQITLLRPFFFSFDIKVFFYHGFGPLFTHFLLFSWPINYDRVHKN
jgi:hypothetical protein